MLMIILNPNRLRHQTKTKIIYLGKLISNILQAIDRGHDDPRNRIWDDPKCLIWLSAYSSIYSKAEDHETENKTQWYQIYQIRNNTSSCNFNLISYKVLWPRTGSASYHLLCCSSLESNSMYTVLISLKKKIVNGIFTELLHFSIVLSIASTLCLRPVSVTICPVG